MSDGIYDPLTGAFSRSHLNLRLEQEWSQGEHSQLPFSILMIDLDYFKSVNDAFGHARGDQVLIEVVHRLQQSLRKVDEVFRYGGDEFILLLPQTDLKGAVSLARRVSDQMDSQPLPGTPPIHLTLSIGVASYPEDAITLENLFAVADHRLRVGKAQQRGRISWREEQWHKPDLLAAPDRLIERDQALRSVKSFMDELSVRRRGVLQVNGMPGMGRSRFIWEVEKIARLRGLAVLSLHGQPAFKSRMLSCLFEALEAWEDRPQRISEAASLAQAFQERITQKNLAGLIVSVDEWAQIDAASQELIADLLRLDLPETLGLVVSGGEAPGSQLPVGGIDWQCSVELPPLSVMGVRVWLRHSLGWEPPQEVVDWLYKHTFGIPAWLQRAQTWLTANGVLVSTGEGWVLQPGYTEIDLQGIARLPFEPAHNLPFPFPRMFDRHEEIYRIKQLLAEHSVVTVMGLGGVGKTRLALQVAAESLSAFADGVYFIELDSLTSAEFLLPALIQAVGAPEASGVGQISAQRLFNYLLTRRVLLVLDGFDHVADRAPLIGQLVERCPGVRILITSQRRLQLPQEAVVHLHGLRHPAGPAEEGIAGFPAVQLFLQTARRLDPQFTPSQADLGFVARICHILEGMPLGLELAASSLSLLNCEQIALSLTNNLASLGAFAVDADAVAETADDQPEQRRSLVAVFDSFLNLLSQNEQEILARLSVFHGGFSASAAQVVTGASPFFLDALSDRLYLRKSAQRRFILHSSFGRYLAEKLRQHPQQERMARQQHAQWYADFLQGRQPVADWARDISIELENIRSAWEWAVEHQQVEIVQKMLPGWMTFLRDHGLFLQAVAGLKRVQGFLQNLAGPSAGERHLLGRVLIYLGEFAYHLGDYSEGRCLLRQAVQIFQELEKRHDEIQALQLLANNLRADGDYLAASAVLQKSLQRIDLVEDPHLAFELLNSLGVCEFLLKKYQESMAIFTRALELARQLEDPGKQAVSLNNLADCAYETGAYEQASQLLLEAVKVSEQVETLTLKGAIWDTLGKTYCALGEYAQAATQYLAALRQVQGIDALPLVLGILVSVAELYKRTGRPGDAAQLLRLVLDCPVAQSDVYQRAANLLESLPRLELEAAGAPLNTGSGETTARRVPLAGCEEKDLAKMVREVMADLEKISAGN